MFGSSVAPADLHPMIKLIEVLTDPEKAKAEVMRLEKMKADAEEALAASVHSMDELMKAKADFDEQMASGQTELKARQDDLAADQAKHEADVEQHNSEVEARLAAIAQQEEQLRSTAKRQADYEAQLTDREGHIKALEASQAIAEEALAKRTEETEHVHAQSIRVKNEHEQKLATLRKIIGEPDQARLQAEANGAMTQ
jgi:chromosome segregation ATPase